MTDTASPSRVEPILDPNPKPTASPVAELRAAVEARPVPAAATVPVGAAPASSAPEPAPASDSPRSALDQLARIEDKAARIEEKYARSEALLARVEAKVDQSTSRSGELARQADLSILREEISALSQQTRRLPGFAALIAAAVVTALVAAVATYVLLRYGLGGTLPR